MCTTTRQEEKKVMVRRRKIIGFYYHPHIDLFFVDRIDFYFEPDILEGTKDKNLEDKQQLYAHWFHHNQKLFSIHK